MTSTTGERLQKRFKRTARGRKRGRQQAKANLLPQSSGIIPTPSSLPRTRTKSKWGKPLIEQSHPYFSKLPVELRTKVLSCLPHEEISSNRKVCQQMYDLIAQQELQIAGPKIRYHIKRLQNHVDSITAARLPTDTESFIDVLRLWTSTRGVFTRPNVSERSWMKWFSFLAGNEQRTTAGPHAEFERWARTADDKASDPDGSWSCLQISNISPPRLQHR